MINWLLEKLTRKGRARRRHDDIVHSYREFAAGFGDSLSYAFVGRPIFYHDDEEITIEEKFHLLDEHEEAYASLGYRIVTIDRWIAYGGYSESIVDVWLIKRNENERPAFTKDTVEMPGFPINSPIFELLE